MTQSARPPTAGVTAFTAAAMSVSPPGRRASRKVCIRVAGRRTAPLARTMAGARVVAEATAARSSLLMAIAAMPAAMRVACRASSDRTPSSAGVDDEREAERRLVGGRAGSRASRGARRRPRRCGAGRHPARTGGCRRDRRPHRCAASAACRDAASRRGRAMSESLPSRARASGDESGASGSIGGSASFAAAPRLGRPRSRLDRRERRAPRSPRRRCPSPRPRISSRSRCHTAGATAFTSSMATAARPSRSARARPHDITTTARGPAP